MSSSFVSPRNNQNGSKETLNQLFQSNIAKIKIFKQQSHMLTRSQQISEKEINEPFRNFSHNYIVDSRCSVISPIASTSPYGQSSPFKKNSKLAKNFMNVVNSPYQLQKCHNKSNGTLEKIYRSDFMISPELNNAIEGGGKSYFKINKIDYMGDPSESQISQSLTTQVSKNQNICFNTCPLCRKNQSRNQSLYQQNHLRTQNQRLLNEQIRSDQKLQNLENRLKALQNGTIFKSLETQIQTLKFQQEILVQENQEKFRIERQDYQLQIQVYLNKIQLLNEQLSINENELKKIVHKDIEIKDLKKKLNVLGQSEVKSIHIMEDKEAILRAAYQLVDELRDQSKELKNKVSQINFHSKQINEIIKYLVNKQDPPLDLLINRKQELKQHLNSFNISCQLNKDTNTNLLKSCQLEIKNQIECNILVNESLKLLQESLCTARNKVINELGRNLVHLD